MKTLVLFSFILVMVLSLAGCTGQPVFEIEDFELTKDESDYSIFYEGNGEIKTTATGMYQVFLRVKRKRGGNPEEKKESMYYTEVIDGEGKLFTFDYMDKDEGIMEEPKYKFEVIGYIKINEIKNKP